VLKKFSHSSKVIHYKMTRVTAILLLAVTLWQGSNAENRVIRKQGQHSQHFSYNREEKGHQGTQVPLVVDDLTYIDRYSDDWY
jgi:hypothetical protein